VHHTLVITGLKEDPDDGGNLFRRQQIPIGPVRGMPQKQKHVLIYFYSLFQ